MIWPNNPQTENKGIKKQRTIVSELILFRSVSLWTNFAQKDAAPAPFHPRKALHRIQQTPIAARKA